MNLPFTVPVEEPICTELHYLPSVTLFELEGQYLRKALEYHGKNKSAAAESLGLSIKTLYNKIHKHGLYEEFKGYFRRDPRGRKSHGKN